MNTNTAITVNGLGKRYPLKGNHERHDTLIDLFISGPRSLIRNKKKLQARQDSFWALKDANFDIKRGENVGIIGLNGAGKSTLLKILSRITEPTAGRARIAGRVGALLEVGTGFHWELTGRENVYLYGTILGMNKADISRKFDSIVAFADVEEFIDLPVKRYSSGMYVRLAFAVAAHLEPEILLLDEVLSVGDLSFQRKCIEFAKNLQKANATILFVSHNMFSIKTMCERVIYLKHGEIKFDGATDKGIGLYEEDCRLTTLPWIESKPGEWPIVISNFALFDQNEKERTVFDHGDQIKIRMDYITHKPIKNPNFIIALIRSDGVPCCNYSTEADGIFTDWVNGKGRVELVTPPLKLVSDTYTIHIIIREQGFQKVLCAQIGSTVHIRHHLLDTHFGVFHEPGEWTLTDRKELKQVI